MEIRAGTVSRRGFWKMMAGAGLFRPGLFGYGLCGAAWQQADSGTDPFRWDDVTGDVQRSERQYRVDAQVLFLGATIFRRNGVGGGHAVWSEAGPERRKLEFTGFSNPER